MTFDLNLLLTFEAMDKARSVSDAAKLLGLSQPATSAALGRLRKAMNDELFAYVGGSMQPTPKARRLAPRIGTTLAEFRAALDGERGFDPALAREHFTIGITDYVGAVFAPALIATLVREAPGITLTLASYTKTEVGQMIGAGAFDLAIGVFPDPPENTVVTALLQESFVGIARNGHPALASPLDAARFAKLDHALFTVSRDGRGAIDVALARLGLTRRVVLSLPQLMALPEIVRQTDLVASVPGRTASLFGPQITVFDLGFLALEPWTLHMLWSPFTRRDAAYVWLRSKVTTIFAHLGGQLR